MFMLSQRLPAPKKILKFSIDTIEDLWNNDLYPECFIFLEKLLELGHEIEFHRVGNISIDICTTIRDLIIWKNLEKVQNLI